MDIYEQIATKIIQSQEAIIGPIAVEQAMLVPNLQLDWDNHKVSIEGTKPQVVNILVEVYKEIFGQTSVEVSKEAVNSLMHQLDTVDRPKALV